jgi:hypothetical protein
MCWATFWATFSQTHLVALVCFPFNQEPLDVQPTIFFPFLDPVAMRDIGTEAG